MANEFASDLLEIELQSELELLASKDEDIGTIDDIQMDDIFSSSSDADYKLFDWNEDALHGNDENTNIWKSYFDKMSIKEQKYLSESNNVLTQMNRECADTLKICSNHPEAVIVESTGIPTKLLADCIQIEEETITENPCVPSHIISEPHSPPKQHKLQSVAPKNQDENTDVYQTELENLENE